MEILGTVLGVVFSEKGLTAIASVLGTLFLLLKKKEVDGVKAEWNSKVAFDALYVGVLQAFQRYVKGLKEQQDSISEEEEKEAHIMATKVAEHVAATKGVNLRATVGDDFIDYNIKKIVEDLKTKGIISRRNS